LTAITAIDSKDEKNGKGPLTVK